MKKLCILTYLKCVQWWFWSDCRLIWIFLGHTCSKVCFLTSWFISCLYEPAHDKTNKMVCAPSEDSDQPGHPPRLIRVFAVHSMGSKGLKLSSCGQRRLWSEWADVQADLNLRWARMPFCNHVMPWLIWQRPQWMKTKPFHYSLMKQNLSKISNELNRINPRF